MIRQATLYFNWAVPAFGISEGCSIIQFGMSLLLPEKMIWSDDNTDFCTPPYGSIYASTPIGAIL